MRPLLTLIRKDLALLLHDKTAVALTFLVPVALIYIFGQVFGISREAPGPNGIPLAVVNASDHPAAARLVTALQAETAFRVITEFTRPDQTVRPLTEDDLRPLIRANRFRFALVIPEEIFAPDGVGIRLKILSNPRNDIETHTTNGLLQRTIFTHVPELLGQSLQLQARNFLGAEGLDEFNAGMARTIAESFGGDPAEITAAIAAGDFGLNRSAPATGADDTSAAAADESEDILGQLVAIETEQVVGQDVKSPAATRVVGGWAMMFLLFALSSSATSVFEEKKAGLYHRLLSGSVTRTHILLGKFCYGVLLGLVQLVALFLAGQLMFGIDIISHLPLLVLVSLAAAAACTAFGMLLASIAPTPQAASGLATFLILVMSAIGGAWFPVSFMPDFIQAIAQFTIVYWAMEGFLQVLWAGDSFRQILPTLGILAGATTAVMTVAVWRFNRGRIFE